LLRERVNIDIRYYELVSGLQPPGLFYR